MSKSGIYQIILKEDGRSYIGSAVDIEQRWQTHKKNSRKPLGAQVISRALNVHGIENFDWIVLELCTIDQLLEREQFWLDTVRPFADEGTGFNVRKLANSNIGIKRSAESRKKQSNTMKGVLKTEEHKHKMSEVWHNNRGEPYYKQLSDRIKGENNPAKRIDVAAKISASRMGQTWKHDTDRVAKHIAFRKGKTRTDDAKLNMKIAQQQNKTRSAEAKEKFYLAQRVLYEITNPHGNKIILYSRELKIFCADNSLGYSNLITTAKTNKPYKNGWIARRI
jgi:group I intron endonuclease